MQKEGERKQLPHCYYHALEANSEEQIIVPSRLLRIHRLDLF
jgi:hypothetical protein